MKRIIILALLIATTIFAGDKPKIKLLYRDTKIQIFCIDGYKWILLNEGKDIEQMFEREGNITSLTPVKCK